MKASICLLAAGLMACAPSQKKSTVSIDPNFECESRRAEYTVVGGLMYEEFGVRMSCEGNRPIVERFATKNDATTERTGSVILASVWNDRYSELESAGWSNLRDCDNPDAEADDPMYTFVMMYKGEEYTVLCQGEPLPYPYDRLKTSFDLAASHIRDP